MNTCEKRVTNLWGEITLRYDVNCFCFIRFSMFFSRRFSRQIATNFARVFHTVFHMFFHTGFHNVCRIVFHNDFHNFHNVFHTVFHTVFPLVFHCVFHPTLLQTAQPDNEGNKLRANPNRTLTTTRSRNELGPIWHRPCLHAHS